MTTQKQFKLPDIGEGLIEGEILKWYVQPGDTVTVNQTLVEVETAKAAVELPSPFAGVVTELHFPEGTTVDVGTPIITIDTAPEGTAVATPVSSPPAQSPALREDLVPDIPVPADEGATEPGLIGSPAPGERNSVLVGYGPRTAAAVRRPRKATAAPAAAPAARSAPGPVPEPAQAPAPAPANGAAGGNVRVLAKPPVRKLAKDLGVDLAAVAPTGPGGTITRGDVEAYARSGAAEEQGGYYAPPQDRPASRRAPAGAGPAGWDDARERRIPIKGVRKMTAQAMVASAFTAPHATEFLTVDVTRTMRLVRRFKELPEFAENRVSPLLIVAKALLVAVRRHPEINASWDEAAQEIVIKDYVNLGIAAATPRGLIVPNIKDADGMSLPELATAMNDLVRVARDGKTAPADMAGGTITITNVGVFGVDTGTPILNPGEAAILAFGAVREQPWVHKGKVKPRHVTTLGLSFDHRLIDGELGSRFLADVGRILTDPTTALAWS
jgi:pyruvate dehydrogenase E2 component (dihydrolipoamide acetyltransferase)